MRKWQPYGDQRNPGVWTNVMNMYPTRGGSYRVAPSWSTNGTAGAGPATPGTQLNAWCGVRVDGTSIGYVGTTTKLYEISSLSTGSFTDRSKGGGYTNTATSWCFTQFGNITIATNYVDSVQSRDASGSSAFADLAGSPPKAKICITQSNAVLLFGYNDGTAYLDGWWASDIGDHTTWTPASSNDAANGRILQRPGPITAAVAFKDEVIVFKDSSIFKMRYVGAPFYWTVTLVADGVGASSMGAVASCGSFIVFNGVAGSYIFDGQTLTPIADGFATTTGNILASAGNKASQGGVFYGSQGIVCFPGADTAYYIYNVMSNSWGSFTPHDGTGATLNSATGDVYYIPLVGDDDAIRGMGTAGTFGSNGSCLIGLGENPCVLNEGSATTGDYTSVLITSYFGEEGIMSNVSRISPVWSHAGGVSWTHSATASDYQASLYLSDTPNASGTQTSAVNVSSASKRFDLNHTARFIKLRLDATADCEVMDLIPVIKPAGTD